MTTEFRKQVSVTFEILNMSSTGEVNSVEQTLELPDILRVAGNIVLTTRGRPSQAMLEVYNLQNSWRVLLANRTVRMTIKGGTYGSTLVTIYKGIVTNTINTRQGVDIITTFYSNVLYNSWKDATISKTYNGVTTYKQILKDLCSAVPNTTGSPSFTYAPNFSASAYTIKNPTLHGNVKSLLDQYCNIDETNESNNITYHLSNEGQFIFSDIAGTLSGASTVNIDTVGMIIGIPTIEQGWITVKTHFNSSIDLFTTLNISTEFASYQMGNLYYVNAQKISSSYTGEKRIREVIHEFDNRASTGWTTTITASTY